MIKEKIKIEGCLASLDKVTGTGQCCEVRLDRNSTPVSNKRKCNSRLLLFLSEEYGYCN